MNVLRKETVFPLEGQLFPFSDKNVHEFQEKSENYSYFPPCLQNTSVWHATAVIIIITATGSPIQLSLVRFSWCDVNEPQVSEVLVALAHSVRRSAHVVINSFFGDAASASWLPVITLATSAPLLPAAWFHWRYPGA